MSSSTLQGTVVGVNQAINQTPLTGNDMCDRCRVAQAYVRVELPGDLELLFCKHDYERAEPSLLAAGAAVYDQRADLEPKPFDPATDNS